jgi:hypothetical protein
MGMGTAAGGPDLGGGLHAQTVAGIFPLLAGQPVRLEGFRGFQSCTISSITSDDRGSFTLPYSDADRGVGYLISADDKPLFVILSGEDIGITGDALSYTGISGQRDPTFPDQTDPAFLSDFSEIIIRPLAPVYQGH